MQFQNEFKLFRFPSTITEDSEVQILFDPLIPDSTQAEIETFDLKCSLESSNQILESIMAKVDDDDMRSELDNLRVSESQLRSELEAVSHEDLKYLLPSQSVNNTKITVRALKKLLLRHLFGDFLLKRDKPSDTHQQESIYPWLQQLQRARSSASIKHTSFPQTSSISFSNVEVRKYYLTLGDHPECGSGPPISLDWDYTDEETVSVDYYEDHRGPNKTLSEMELEPTVRRSILQKGAGISAAEIEMAEKEMARIRKQRRITQKLSYRPARKLEETLCSAKRKAMRIVHGRRDVCIAREQGRLVRSL